METHADLAAAVTELGCFVLGGVAEDAVLDGAITRPHSDVDVLVLRHDVDRLMPEFEALGYRDWEVWLRDSRGTPQVLHSATLPVEVELEIFDGEPGDYYFELTAPGDERLHALLHPTTFDFPAVRLDGQRVQTLSPASLYCLRATIAASGAFGEFRPQDAPAQQRLREELLADVDEADLAPLLRPA